MLFQARLSPLCHSAHTTAAADNAGVYGLLPQLAETQRELYMCLKIQSPTLESRISWSFVSITQIGCANTRCIMLGLSMTIFTCQDRSAEHLAKGDLSFGGGE